MPLNCQEEQTHCADCSSSTSPVMPPQNTQNCPQPLPCSKYTKSVCVKETVKALETATTITLANTYTAITVTELASAVAFANPTDSFDDFFEMKVRLKDDGTARAISFGSAFRVIGTTLPTTTTANKITFLRVVYNKADLKFDVIEVKQEV